MMDLALLQSGDDPRLLFYSDRANVATSSISRKIAAITTDVLQRKVVYHVNLNAAATFIQALCGTVYRQCCCRDARDDGSAKLLAAALPAMK